MPQPYPSGGFVPKPDFSGRKLQDRSQSVRILARTQRPQTKLKGIVLRRVRQFIDKTLNGKGVEMRRARNATRRGGATEPGFLLIEGKLSGDGSAKLAANGIVASRKYARGVFARKGKEYNYDIRAQFSETEGTGTRRAGLGIVGRVCTFDFVKQ